jgi:hypothetical protein
MGPLARRLSDDVEIGLGELPDDDDIGIEEFLSDAVKAIADEYVSDFASGRKISDGGTVTFNVPARKISVSAECEVTTEEMLEESWSV